MTIKVTTTEELYSKVLVVYGYGCGVWLQGLHEPNICHTHTITTEHVWRTWSIYRTLYWILLTQKKE